jgi:hypothetical protein
LYNWLGVLAAVLQRFITLALLLRQNSKTALKISSKMPLVTKIDER